MGAIISLLLYQPPSPSSYELSQSPAIFKTIPLFERVREGTVKELQTANIPYVFLPATKERMRRIVILHSHGNATDLGQMLPFLKLLRDRLQVDVCSYDYVGYGPNLHLKASEHRLYDSIAAVIRHLQSEYNFKTEDIILFGTSLGSGPSVEMASRYQFRGLILQSPFTSVIRTKISRLNLRYFDMFVNIEKVPHVRCPTLFLHGEKDDLVPVDHSRQLWNVLNCEYQLYKPVYIPGAGHNNIIEKYTILKYVQTLQDFLDCLETWHCSKMDPNNKEKLSSIERNIY